MRRDSGGDIMLLSINKNYLRRKIKEGIRQDGRKMDEFRKIEIIPNFINESAEGSCMVKIGNTKVLAGVKISLGAPYPDTPDEGILITNAELVPVASPEYEAGPPGEDAIELARVVDRGIRESRMIDMKDLCIIPGEKVYMINLDLHILDNDGNIFDASSLSSIVALLTTKIPEYDENNDCLIRENMKRRLKLNDLPVSITARIIDGQILYDPNLYEEEISDARLTVSFKKNGNICAIQKGGEEELDIEKIMEIVKKSKKVSEKLRKEVEKLKIR